MSDAPLLLPREDLIALFVKGILEVGDPARGGSGEGARAWRRAGCAPLAGRSRRAHHRDVTGRRSVLDADAAYTAAPELGDDSAIVVADDDVPTDLALCLRSLAEMDETRGRRLTPQPGAVDGTGEAGQPFGQRRSGVESAVEDGGVGLVARLVDVAAVPSQNFVAADVQFVQHLEIHAVVETLAIQHGVEGGRAPVVGHAVLEGGQVDRGRGGAEQAADTALGMKPPLLARGGRAGDAYGAVLGGHGRLDAHGHRFIPGERQRRGNDQVRHLDGGAENPAAGGHRHLHVPHRRHEDCADHLVVLQPGQQRRLDGPEPGGLQQGHALAEQRMVDRPVATGAHPLPDRPSPMAFALPGVGGQVDHAPGPREPAGGVDGRAGCDQVGSRRVDRSACVGVAPKRGHDRRRAGRPGDAAQVGAQDRMGPHLDEDVVPFGPQVLAGLGEHDGPAHVVPPVTGVQGHRSRTAGDSGDERHSWFGRPKIGERVPQGLLDRIHEPAVEGALDVELAEEHARVQPRLQLGDRVELTGDGHVAFGVHGRDLEATREWRQRLFRLRPAQTDRGHATLSGGQGLGPAARGDHAAGGGQIERAGGMGGRHLAHAVAHHRCRTDPPTGQQLDQADLQGEQSRLTEGGLLQPGSSSRRGQLSHHRPSQQWAQRPIDLLDRRPEDRLGLEQVGTHRRPLRTVPRKDERHPTAARRHPAGRAVSGLSPGQRRQSLRRDLRSGRQHDGSVRVQATAARRGVADVVELGRGGDGQLPGKSIGCFAQGLAGAARDNNRQLIVRRPAVRHTVADQPFVDQPFADWPFVDWGGRGSGGSARTAWALAPPKPKLFTPTTPRPPPVDRLSCTGARPRTSKSIEGFGGRPWSDGGITRCRSTRIALRMPGIPDAGSM